MTKAKPKAKMSWKAKLKWRAEYLESKRDTKRATPEELAELEESSDYYLENQQLRRNEKCSNYI